jgi:hypothetical protein
MDRPLLRLQTSTTNRSLAKALHVPYAQRAAFDQKFFLAFQGGAANASELLAREFPADCARPSGDKMPTRSAEEIRNHVAIIGHLYSACCPSFRQAISFNPTQHHFKLVGGQEVGRPGPLPNKQADEIWLLLHGEVYDYYKKSQQESKDAHHAHAVIFAERTFTTFESVRAAFGCWRNAHAFLRSCVLAMSLMTTIPTPRRSRPIRARWATVPIPPKSHRIRVPSKKVPIPPRSRRTKPSAGVRIPPTGRRAKGRTGVRAAYSHLASPGRLHQAGLATIRSTRSNCMQNFSGRAQTDTQIGVDIAIHRCPSIDTAHHRFLCSPMYHHRLYRAKDPTVLL